MIGCVHFAPVVMKFILVIKFSEMMLLVCLSVGPLHRESAELGPQQALGRGGGVPPRVCPHADEAVSGKVTPSTFLNDDRRQ